jgi:hypothetical protein
MHLRGLARWLAAVAVPLAVGGALAGPGPAASAAARPAAAGVWSPADLTAAAGAPAAASAPDGYETDFARGPVPRVVYRTAAGHIEELSLQVLGDGLWHARDLSVVAAGAPAATGVPSGAEFFLPGQGLVARVVYRTAAGHIEELRSQDDVHWQPLDLTAAAGAPAAASAPSGYGTNMPGQSSLAHVVYRTAAGHIEDLSSLDLVHWQSADLTAAAGAPAATGAPDGYATNLDADLAAQGAVARVVYRTAAGHIEELRSQDDVHWQPTDLSAIAGGPLAASAPDGYQSDLIAAGSVVRSARVVYQDAAGHIEEIRQQTGGQWQPPVDLSTLAGGPAAASAPSGYETAVSGQFITLRVVYMTGAGHIEEISFS